MFRSNPPRPLRRLTLIVGAPLILGACTTWYDTPTPMPSASNELRSPVRITRRDGFQIMLDAAEVHGDSVVGIEHAGQHRRRAVALADVARMEHQGVDPVNTALVGAGAALAAFGAFVLLVIAELGSGYT
ncbi:MAG TPA: hypothetical protein VFJ16_27920 [Longimicrobium sp.]|nr:hypothetical protein [Longimicrobium sp.]